MLLCMRTTIELNDELLRQAKRQATRDGSTLRKIVEQALRAHLARHPRPSGYRLVWRTEHGRLQSGVSLDDRDVLLDVMEGRR